MMPRSDPEMLAADAGSAAERAPWGAVVVCGMPFDGTPPFSDTHLPKALSRRRPVLVVDPPLSIHRWRPGQPLAASRRLQRVGEHLWRFRPLALPGRDRTASALASDPLIARQLEWAASQVLPARRVLVTFSPARGWLDGLRRDVSVYWRRDISTLHTTLAK